MSADPNPYAAPQLPLWRPTGEGENTSGMGKGHPIPDGVQGWSWGAFLLNWIWGLGNSTFIGLLTLIPYIGFVMAIVLGINGREWAWQNKRWESVEHFNRVQRTWSAWGLGVVVAMIVIGVVGAIMASSSS